MSDELRVFRTEKKYELSLFESEMLFSKLRNVLEGDPYNGNEAYMVRSLYFDTINNTDYWEKMNGLTRRKKIRLRVYSPYAEYAKLELKEKQGTAQLKRSLVISRADAMELQKENYEILKKYNQEIAEEFYNIMTTSLYRPSCIVEYKRRAFANYTNDTRITFDSGISSNEGNFNVFDKNLLTYPVLSPDSVILEVKYNGFLLSYIKELVNSCDKMEQSNSKYCMARTYGLG